MNFYNNQQKKIGRIYNKRFQKTVKKSRHLFKKSDSWGIDADIFTKYLEPENLIIQFSETEEGISYFTTASIYRKYGHFLHFTGHDAQIFLPRLYFLTVKKGQSININKNFIQSNLL